MKRKLAATAYHEAGHTVAAVLLNEDFDYVTIESMDDSLGHIKYINNWTRVINLVQGISTEILEYIEIDQIVRNRFIVSLSGYTAELKFGIANNEGAESDFNMVRQVALSHAGTDASEYIDHCLEESTKLIGENWSKVEAVANNLLHYTQISRADVLKCISEAI